MTLDVLTSSKIGNHLTDWTSIQTGLLAYWPSRFSKFHIQFYDPLELTSCLVLPEKLGPSHRETALRGQVTKCIDSTQGTSLRSDIESMVTLGQVRSLWC